MGFSDEGIARILAALPGPDDGTGIPREYAAGSAQQDYQNTERAANAAAAAEHPIAYGAGMVAGGAPAAMAMPAGVGGSAAARVAAGGLSGGLMGGLSGAGHADGSDNIGKEIGSGALMGGALGTGGAAAIESIPMLKAAMAQIGAQKMAPATAGAGSELGGAQINQAGMLPPRPTTGDMPTELFVPKAPKPMVHEGAVDAAEDLADASMASNTAKANFGSEGSGRAAARAQAQKAFDEAQPSIRPGSTNMKGTVAPPKSAKGRALAKAQSAETVPAPAGAGPTAPAPAPVWQSTPSMHPTMPAPGAGPTTPAPAMPSLRPTMPAMGPLRPTLKPGTEQMYKDAVLRELANGLR